MNINPINNKEAEEAVLGGILLDCLQSSNNNILSRVSLSPEDFYFSVNQKIFKAMLELNRAEIPIDTITLSNHLNDHHTEISRIAGEAITAVNILSYTRITKTLSDKRKLQKLCIDTLQGLNDSTSDISEDIGAINKQIKGILTGRGGDIVSMKDVSAEVLELLERRTNDRGSLSGIPTGFDELDMVSDGLQSGDLNVLAGRPGKGKSALAMAINHHAVKNDFPCGFISLEMGKSQIGIRSLASSSGIELWRLRKGSISSELYRAVIKAAGSLAELPLYFSFSARGINDIQRAITQMIEVNNVKMITLDYLQLCRNPEARGNREREIGEISTTLKHLARVYEIPILCLAQLNREPEKRGNGRPILADLRDSGQLEQDADVVLFLWDSDRGNVINVDIAKGRNIGTGSFKLHFDKSKMSFRNI